MGTTNEETLEEILGKHKEPGLRTRQKGHSLWVDYEHKARACSVKSTVIKSLLSVQVNLFDNNEDN